jgi:hypothetical protein
MFAVVHPLKVKIGIFAPVVTSSTNVLSGGTGEAYHNKISSRSTVTNYLKHYGIPLKNVNNRQKGKTCFGFRQYGVRTKSGKAVWYSKVVRQVLLREATRKGDLVTIH